VSGGRSIQVVTRLVTEQQRGWRPAIDTRSTWQDKAAVPLRRVEPEAAGACSGRLVAPPGRPEEKRGPTSWRALHGGRPLYGTHKQVVGIDLDLMVDATFAATREQHCGLVGADDFVAGPLFKDNCCLPWRNGAVVERPVAPSRGARSPRIPNCRRMQRCHARADTDAASPSQQSSGSLEAGLSVAIPIDAAVHVATSHGSRPARPCLGRCGAGDPPGGGSPAGAITQR
jgi:hypothetical protein